ncbi:TMV resistance protein N-like isoform X3 [Vigna unguiculata]|uniref:TMV resistance protein N-like isoform X3 n=1 Tax=Vigna unguiculata TaxID=3917 RepID=UPI0010171DB2|nr:TMV resistance protein N-like isoform X3 [Vigna unguiculata]
MCIHSSLFHEVRLDLCFRGEDTRMNFTSHLHEALKEKKVETYIDYQLEKGDEISPAVFKAIEDSRVSIVILSENYASSKWCLEELSKILECHRNQEQIVIPVFYNVDPSHVRKQTGCYEQSFATHEEELRCNKWRSALTAVANLAGWDSRNRIESQFIKDVVKDVIGKLTPRYPNELKGLVGIEKSFKQIESLLKIGSSEVRTVGIWGMGGIGKTTLAIALYDKLSHEFEGRCVLTNIREKSDKLEGLRDELLSKLLGNKIHGIDYFDMRRLQRKKVFIVLDDVDTSEQIEKLILEYEFLGPGSKVIVTTRNKQILSLVDEIYQVEELSSYHSLQLFCLTISGEKQPKDGYEDLSKRAILYCKGLPMALKVLGSNLRKKSKVVWECELRKLQKIPNVQIHNVLKLSYECLDRSQKDIFLDIVCFFNGWERDRVTYILEACDFFAASGIETLLDKTLVTISNYSHIKVNDLIQKMGWEIVHQESIKDLGRRSRLWKQEEVYDVLKYNKGTDFVEGMVLDLEQLAGDLYLSCDSLAKMTNMRILRIHRRKWGCRFSVHLPDGIELPYKLRYLEWEGFCLRSLPSNFCAEQLVELHMWNSKLKMLWDGVQNLVNLKTIDLDDSRDLIEIPDLSMAEKLERVSLYDCESLCKLHPSISSLPKLKYLILSGCKVIQSVNVHSKSLNVLRLRGCSSLSEFSVTSEEMTHLDLSQTAIRELLSPMISLPKLTYLYLSGCRHIENVNLHLRSLRVLTLVGCSCLKEFSVASDKLTLLELPDTAIGVLPSSIGHLLSLEELDLRGTNIECLPASIKSLSMLRVLWLNDCKKLVSVQELPPSLRELHINDCWKLVSLPELPPSVKEVSAFNCRSLEENITQELVLRHMLQSCIPDKHQQYPYNPVYFDGGYFIFPGDHITDNCAFHATESSITIPSLPRSHLWGYIFCIIIAKGPMSDHQFSCSIYQEDILVGCGHRRFIGCENLISDHVLFFYHDVINFGGTDEVYGPFNSFTFMFEFNGDKHTIKGCGVFPVYLTSSGFKFCNVDSQPRANGPKIGGCDKENLEQLFAAKRRKTA